eukprot:1289807-Pleurochrysis_carterae.AAC.5
MFRAAVVAPHCLQVRFGCTCVAISVGRDMHALRSRVRLHTGSRFALGWGRFETGLCECANVARFDQRGVNAISPEVQ